MVAAPPLPKQSAVAVFTNSPFHGARPALPVIVGPPTTSKEKQRKRPPRPDEKIWRTKEMNKGKLHSRAALARPPLRLYPPPCPLGGPVPLLYTRLLLSAQHRPRCPHVPQESDRWGTRPLPLARLPHILPQPSPLLRPRRAPREQMVPRLRLSTHAPPTIGRVCLSETQSMRPRRCMPR